MTGESTPAAAGPSWARIAALAAVTGAVAAGVRLWTLAALEASNPLFHVTILDEAVYLREAARLADGLEPTSPSLVSLFWPWILATFGAVERSAASLVNVAIGSLTAALAAAGAARAARSLVAGSVAGGIAALSGGLVFQDCTAQTEPVLGFLVLATVLALVRAARVPSPGRIALAGFLGGCAALGRGTHLVMLLGALPALRGAGFRAGTGRAVVLALAAAVPILVFDGAVGALPTSGGVNVWLGNNAWSRETLSFGTSEFPMDPDGEAIGVARIAERAEGRPLSAAEINAWWARRAVREMAESGDAAAGHLLRKTVLLLYPSDTGGNHDAVVEREFAPYLRAVPVSYAWILVAGAAGWVAARRTVRGLGGAFLAAVGFVATLVLTFPLTRYVSPAVPAAAVLAGIGAAVAARGHVTGTVRREVAVTAVLLALVSWGSTWMRPPVRPESWSNLGVASMQTGIGDPDTWFRRALEDAPDFPPPAYLLGVRALDTGRPVQALEWMDRALAAADGRPKWTGIARDAAVGRSRALSALGRHREALEFHDRVREQLRDDAALAAEGVFLAIAAGDRDGARRRLAAARAIDATHPRVLDAARAVGGR